MEVDNKVKEYLTRARKIAKEVAWTTDGQKYSMWDYDDYPLTHVVKIAQMIQTEELRIIKWIEGSKFKNERQKKK